MQIVPTQMKDISQINTLNKRNLQFILGLVPGSLLISGPVPGNRFS
jgi:hypothetical protein